MLAPAEAERIAERVCGSLTGRLAKQPAERIVGRVPHAQRNARLLLAMEPLDVLEQEPARTVLETRQRRGGKRTHAHD